ncbi:HotDog domain-containing protein [Roridomyces roridus]|uniref:HotDog domain-containing protein n=1 Tax=Roridomyces roridus TaxID=1738132 RepID=A0AAD7BI72_9AGAR|nr:HotDog domain-containing protein [Roridomyces roridus]
MSAISGNASDEVKTVLSDIPKFFGARVPNRFGDSIVQRMKVTHASLEPKADEPRKKEGKVVCEVEVREDMLNGGGNVHGGCSAFLVDLCSTLALIVFEPGVSTVSQSLNIVYHSPATLGDTLRIVNTTLTVGARAMSARTEIWNKTHHRLVASGVHIKMQPSAPAAKL